MSTTPDWQSIADYGAVSGPGNDCSGAFSKAIAAAGPGGTVYIPSGQWWIQNTVTTNGVNLVGDGWQSCIVPDLGPDAIAVQVTSGTFTENDAGQLIPSSQEWANLVQFSNFSIIGSAAGATPCCYIGLSIVQVTRSVFQNVHVLVQASTYCVCIGVAWSNTFNFICSYDMNEVYSAAGLSPGQPQVGYIYGAPAVAVDGVGSGLNGNVFNCICENLPGYLLYLDSQAYTGTSQGNNWITGTYEGTVSSNPGTPLPAIYVNASYNVVIQDVYTEVTAGIYLTDCILPVVMNAYAGNIVLNGTSDAWIDQVLVGQITINANCQFTRLGSLLTNGPATSPGTSPSAAAVIDLSPTTISLASIDTTIDTPATPFQNRVRYTSNAPSNANNGVLNGDFSRWVGGAPEGWGGNGTAVMTGAGCTDPTTNLSANAACVTLTTAPLLYGYTLPQTIPANQWLAVSLWVYLPSQQPAGSTLTQLQLGVQLGSSSQASGVFNQVADGWTRLQAAFFTGSSPSTVTVGVQGNAAGTFYIADVQAAMGVVAPSNNFVPAACVMPTLYLNSQSITSAGAPPSSGGYNVGDIVYNTAPAPGGWVGWVCTAAGTPGTWTEFGQINSA